jgi:nucleotide-binding universal stress UspA family protein
VSESFVVGTDGSETAKRAVAEAVRLAAALGAQVHVVSAYEPLRGLAAAGAAGFVVPPGEDDDEAVEATLAEAAEAVRAANVAAHTHAVRGTPADALVEVADAVGASLIIVGNQGMHGAKRVLGSVPNSVSHRARCNVLIVSTGSR